MGDIKGCEIAVLGMCKGLSALGGFSQRCQRSIEKSLTAANRRQAFMIYCVLISIHCFDMPAVVKRIVQHLLCETET